MAAACAPLAPLARRARQCLAPAALRALASAPAEAVAQSPSVDAANAAIFAAPGDAWWDPSGAMGPLHAMAPARNAFIADALAPHAAATGVAETTPGRARPLLGLRHADVGCGGGLLVEAMARLGMRSTGIDVAASTIRAAREHAARDAELAARGNLPEFLQSTVEALASDAAHAGAYDVVTSLEVVEHVADVPSFLASLGMLAKPGGHIVLSTINRTPRSYAIAIVGAEHVARVVPVGTHRWDQFLTPNELAERVRDATGASVVATRGMWLHPLRGAWALTDDTAVNYISLFRMPLAAETQ